MEQETKIPKSPIDYLKLFFHRKWLIIVPTVIGIVGGLAAGNMLPKQYESSTLILVEEGRVINPLIEGLAVSTSVAQRLNVLREQILGWDRLNQLIKKLDLAKGVWDQRGFEALVKRLRRYIQVTRYGQNIVRISYVGKDATESMNIVKTITDIFIAENLKQQSGETDNAISFINDQLALYEKKLKQSEISAMEEVLKKLLVDSTDAHPMVIDLRGKINAAKSDLEQGKYTIGSADKTKNSEEMKELKEELAGIRDELNTSSLDADKGGENRTKLSDAANGKLYKLLLLERVQKVTSEDDAGVNKKLYNALLERLETAKITQQLEASKDGTRYTILDPARLPLTPIKPNKLYVLIFGIFMGMCGGFALVLAVEMLDHSFLGVDEARESLGMYLLGAIPKIITEKDIKAQRLRKIKVASVSILTTGVLLVAIIYNVLLGG
ncbi:MAG: hypothetical protein HQL30_09810 [Candidatus Omnitrophica bacterium]|nr:hypothetical protein [Candidatus Omnitrophota bacterium]